MRLKQRGQNVRLDFVFLEIAQLCELQTPTWYF